VHVSYQKIAANLSTVAAEIEHALASPKLFPDERASLTSDHMTPIAYASLRIFQASGTTMSCLRSLCVRGYATSASTLNTTARAIAEQLSADWKGTSLVGGTTKNYIGGKFVESKTENWLEILDPVCSSGVPSSRPVP